MEADHTLVGQQEEPAGLDASSRWSPFRFAVTEAEEPTLKFKILKALPVFVAVVCALAGCASVPLADRKADKAAKTFAVRPGLVNIYVYRNQSFGSAVTTTVAVDGIVIGKTVTDTYVMTEVHPGKHTIISRSENESTLDITTIAGQRYFVRQNMQMGRRRARTVLQLMDDTEGKEELEDCRLAQWP